MPLEYNTLIIGAIGFPFLMDTIRKCKKNETVQTVVERASQYVLNLKTYFISGKWSKVIEIIRKYAA
jgi:Trk-type K+ transport system membrane component